MAKKKDSWWSREESSIIMFIVLVVGGLMIWFSHSEGMARWKDFLGGLGIAMTSAGILGLTLDRLFRQQLVEDAFKASVGYILPEELKGEMEWIYKTHIICTQHIQECELLPIDNETCAIRVKVQRKLCNISHNRDSATLGVATDEWFHKTGISQILSFGYSQEGNKWPSTEGNFDRIKDAYGIQTELKVVSLAPSEEITIWYEVQEIKRTNDSNSWVFQYPTLNPQVTVKAYRGIGIEAIFGYRQPAEKLGLNTSRLAGTLLPGQRIEIRWWEKEDSEKWQRDEANENKVERNDIKNAKT